MRAKNREPNPYSGWNHHFPGAEIAAIVADHYFEDLDGPVKRVASADSHVPFNWFLEEEVLLQTKNIQFVLKELLEY